MSKDQDKWIVLGPGFSLVDGPFERKVDALLRAEAEALETDYEHYVVRVMHRVTTRRSSSVEDL